MSVLDTHDLLDPQDPVHRACDECGAAAGEPCSDACTAWSSLVARVADDDALGASAAGRLAVVIADDLRAARLPGESTATLTGGSCVAVVLTYPSGRDWIVAGIEVRDERPTIYVTQHSDDESAGEALFQVEIHDAISAERAIIALVARGQVRRG